MLQISANVRCAGCDRSITDRWRMSLFSRLKRHAKNLNQITLPEIKDFNALRDN